MANDLALELVLPLRRRLDERLHEAAAVGDDTITASDRVSSAYREVKAQRVGRLAGDWLAAAWAVGVHAATPSGTPGVWAADPANPCCTDCDDNGLAGPVPAGSPFPTGHLHPPAHPGCRCVIVANRRSVRGCDNRDRFAPPPKSAGTPRHRCRSWRRCSS